MKPNIIIAGYGVFGSQFLNWLRTKYPNKVNVIGIVEPNRHKRDLIKKMGINAYESIYDAPNSVTSKTHVVADCSPRGIGLKNKNAYSHLGLKAIFQNGEENQTIGELYYPGLNTGTKPPNYLKIPLCSGIAAIKVTKAIQKIAQVRYITGYHSKVTNTARMLTMNYRDSNYQIQTLLGIECRMNVIYIRGEPYNGIFAYHGCLDLELDRTVKKDDVIATLSNKNEFLKVESQEIDNLTYPRTDLTVIIKESIHIKNRILRLSTMSFTPDVNFPINLAAIHHISKEGDRNAN